MATDLALPIFVDNSSTPIADPSFPASCVVRAWNGLTGAPMTPPTMAHIAGVAYKLVATPLLESACAVVEVDAGATNFPRYVIVTFGPSRAAIGYGLYDNAGDRWSSPSGGTVTVTSTGNTPTLVELDTGIFVLRPDALDLSAPNGAAYVVEAPPTAQPPLLVFGMDPIYGHAVVGPAPYVASRAPIAPPPIANHKRVDLVLQGGNALNTVIIMVKDNDTGIVDVAWDSQAFTAPYAASSTVTVHAPEHKQFQFVRTLGWPSSFDLQVVAVDDAGRTL